MKPEREHQYGEAHMLMWYACQCGHRERIWNSRNGVTPFGIGCSSCGEPTLQHVEWRSDERAINHKLHREQRFFRDGTADEAVAIMERRLTAMEDTFPTTPEYRTKLIETVRRVAEGGGDERDQMNVHEFRPGWPMLDRKSSR